MQSGPLKMVAEIGSPSCGRIMGAQGNATESADWCLGTLAAEIWRYWNLGELRLKVFELLLIGLRVFNFKTDCFNIIYIYIYNIGIYK